MHVFAITLPWWSCWLKEVLIVTSGTPAAAEEVAEEKGNGAGLYMVGEENRDTWIMSAAALILNMHLFDLSSID